MSSSGRDDETDRQHVESREHKNKEQRQSHHGRRPASSASSTLFGYKRSDSCHGGKYHAFLPYQYHPPRDSLTLTLPARRKQQTIQRTTLPENGKREGRDTHTITPLTEESPPNLLSDAFFLKDSKRLCVIFSPPFFFARCQNTKHVATTTHVTLN